MIVNPTWEQIFSSDTTTVKKLRLEFSGGLVLGNENVVSESMELKESICSQSTLKLGSCEASSFKIRLFNNSEPDLTSQRLTVSMYIDDEEEEPDYFQIGEYIVDSDTPTGDRLYHDIVCYDKIYLILGTDYYEWYTEFLTDHTSGYTLKQLRDAFFEHIGITQEVVSLPNDSVLLNRNTTITQLLGKDILNPICELNGAFGHIDRTGTFRYIIPDSTTVDKTYAYYRQGTVDYNKYGFQEITRVVISSDTDTGEAGEEHNNTYEIYSSWLTTGLTKAVLDVMAGSLLTAVENIVYRPFKATTYADLCVEVGDCIQIPTSDFTIRSFVFERTTKGIQALSDRFEAKGDRALPATSTSAMITRLEQQVQNIDSVINEITNRIVTFNNSEEVEIPADTWTQLGSQDFAANALTSLLVHAVAKITLSEDSLVKFRYGISGRGYEPFVHELYMHAPVDTATLFYVLVPPINTPTRLSVEVNTGEATGSVEEKEFHCGFTGTHLITDIWGGILDVEDNFSLIKHGKKTFSYTEDISFAWYDVESVNVSDNYSLVKHGKKTLGFTDSWNVYTNKILYNIISEDGEINLISEDGAYRIINEP